MNGTLGVDQSGNVVTGNNNIGLILAFILGELQKANGSIQGTFGVDQSGNVMTGNNNPKLMLSLILGELQI